MKIDKVEIGMFARSIAGHDKGQLYVIYEKDETYLYLVDGHIRTMDKPKKKKRKHVQIIYKQNEMSQIDDVAIKRILKVFDKEMRRI